MTALEAIMSDLRRLLEDVENYVDQAQVVIAHSDRKGAVILFGMGDRLLDRVRRELADRDG